MCALDGVAYIYNLFGVSSLAEIKRTNNSYLITFEVPRSKNGLSIPQPRTKYLQIRAPNPKRYQPHLHHRSRQDQTRTHNIPTLPRHHPQLGRTRNRQNTRQTLQKRRHPPKLSNKLPQ